MNVFHAGCSKSAAGLTVLWLTTAVWIAAGSAQTSRSGNGDWRTNGRVARAVRVETPPVLDGEVLNDPAYAAAPATTGFWQTAPDEGQPATQRTEVRIVYTADTLYFGVVCYDNDPSHIIISDSRRDASLDETDAFLIILDTYHDRQNGFVFGTNPAGIEYDGQVTNEGEGSGMMRGRQQRGSGSGFNLNWDGSWDVRTKIADYGWSAEFAIPFRTLRFKRQKEQVWGINFQRNIRRRKEKSYWIKLPRQFNLYRLSMAGTLVGLSIPSQRNLKFMPYVLGKAVRDFSHPSATDWHGDFGADAKYSITPSLTLDLTYNTDFAQVEVDEQQINIDRFNLFFPEKRPFFLENAGIFSVGSAGEVELFFSRRIGIGPGGVAIPILGGARLSGKMAGVNVGLLNMQTEAVEGLSPANNFSVARVYKELPNRSSAGVLFVNRQATGGFAEDEEYNRTFAVDGRWGIGQYGQISGFLARTVTPGLTGKDHAFKIGASYNSESWLLLADYTEVADQFNPEVGFLMRGGFRKPNFLIFHRYRPENFLGLQELRPHVSYRGYWKFSGFQETGFLHIDNHWEFKTGDEIHTGINFTREGVVQAFEIYPGITVPEGTYDHVEAQIVAFTNQGAPVSFRIRANMGGFFGGSRVSFNSSLKMRRGETFRTEIAWLRNDISLPNGRFETNLIRARISYSFSPRVTLQALIQYNDRAEMFSTNVRFSWLQSANTGLFIVYNENQDILDSGLGLRDRSLILKYSALIDVLR